MPTLLIHHRVQDFDAWKPRFDDHAATRRVAGCKGGRLWRSANDPNDVIVALEWDDHANARKFAESDDLRQVMQSAGVIGKPELIYMDEVDRPSA